MSPRLAFINIRGLLEQERGEEVEKLITLSFSSMELKEGSRLFSPWDGVARLWRGIGVGVRGRS
jgi:hypothetical protein